MDAKTNSERALQDMRRAGIKFVGVLPSGIRSAACPTARAMKKKKIPIEQAKPLPLDGCERIADGKECFCVFLARA
jgi:hypothetical protein